MCWATRAVVRILTVVYKYTMLYRDTYCGIWTVTSLYLTRVHLKLAIQSKQALCNNKVRLFRIYKPKSFIYYKISLSLNT